jgi:prefoldin subunit 5
MSVWFELKLHRDKLRWPFAVLGAFFLVATICGLDSARQRANSTALSLRWARQMATQAESLSLSASERGEVDPLSWAARILSQGTDSRIIFAQKFHDPQGISTQSSERYEFDSDSGILDYTKVLFPEDSTGIRIKLYVARTGIFGAKTLFAQDLTIAALFSLFLSLFLLSTRKRAHTFELPPPFPKELEEVIEPVAVAAAPNEWMEGFKAALVELGKDIREMTRSAQKLSSSAVQARAEIAAIKTQLEGAVVQSIDPDEMTSLAKEAQALFTTADDETKSLLRKLLQVSLRKASEAESLKKKVEEISSRSDAAFDALKDVSDHTRKMSAGITKTTSGLMTIKRSASG